MTDTAEIGIIGGSGLYEIEDVDEPRYRKFETPFGQPSDQFLLGKIHGRNVAFLSRHGRGHRLNPSEVNYRANLFAFKRLGVSRLVSITAVGSLKEELKPTDLVIPDQYVDRTFRRDKTFFENGIVAHVSLADPVCPVLTTGAAETAKEIGLTVHRGGVYLNMEGPQFSTRAESHMYRAQGFSIIGMTQVVEAKLARELEMCFLPLSFVTDYDCWHEAHESVSVQMVIDNLMKNARNAKRLVVRLMDGLPSDRPECGCASALENAIITRRDQIPAEVLRRLGPVVEKYLRQE